MACDYSERSAEGGVLEAANLIEIKAAMTSRRALNTPKKTIQIVKDVIVDTVLGGTVDTGRNRGVLMKVTVGRTATLKFWLLVVERVSVNEKLVNKAYLKMSPKIGQQEKDHVEGINRRNE